MAETRLKPGQDQGETEVNQGDQGQDETEVNQGDQGQDETEVKTTKAINLTQTPTSFYSTYIDIC